VVRSSVPGGGDLATPSGGLVAAVDRLAAPSWLPFGLVPVGIVTVVGAGRLREKP
jgi:hypothetical protein